MIGVETAQVTAMVHSDAICSDHGSLLERVYEAVRAEDGITVEELLHAVPSELHGHMSSRHTYEAHDCGLPSRVRVKGLVWCSVCAAARF